MYRIELGDCIELMKNIPDGSIDLTVTSPPYDNLRTYENSIDWNFKIFTRIARELYRVTKDGGVVVWVVGDATINGSESGNSFRQALFFKKIGFNLYDTMIWYKKNSMPYAGERYKQSFEYMFILSKSKPNNINLIKEKCYTSGKVRNSFKIKNINNKDITNNYNMNPHTTKDYKNISNVWQINVGGIGISSNDSYAFEHPAIFPESLANDHILSWSNEGDTILDPFLGSGTTAKMAIRNNRNFIGFEKVEKYFRIAERRILEEIDKTALFNYDKAS